MNVTQAVGVLAAAAALVAFLLAAYIAGENNRCDNLLTSGASEQVIATYCGPRH